MKQWQQDAIYKIEQAAEDAIEQIVDREEEHYDIINGSLNVFLVERVPPELDDKYWSAKTEKIYIPL